MKDRVLAPRPTPRRARAVAVVVDHLPRSSPAKGDMRRSRALDGAHVHRTTPPVRPACRRGSHTTTTMEVDDPQGTSPSASTELLRRLSRRGRHRPRADGRGEPRAATRSRGCTGSRSTRCTPPFAGEAVTPLTATRCRRRRARACRGADAVLVALTREPALEGVKAELDLTLAGPARPPPGRRPRDRQPARRRDVEPLVVERAFDARRASAAAGSQPSVTATRGTRSSTWRPTGTRGVEVEPAAAAQGASAR